MSVAAYWRRRLQPIVVKEVPAGSPRIAELAQPKNYSAYGEERQDLEQDRMPKTIWDIKYATLRCSPSARLEHLSKPKMRFRQTDTQPQPDRNVQSGRVSKAALNFEPSERLSSLATPKPRKGQQLKPVPTMVSPYAMKARCSSWVENLSEPKIAHPDFQPEREVSSAVKRQALSAEPTGRLIQLSRPIGRKIVRKEAYDPFKVRPTALELVNVSKRVDELAQPKLYKLN